MRRSFGSRRLSLGCRKRGKLRELRATSYVSTTCSLSRMERFSGKVSALICAPSGCIAQALGLVIESSRFEISPLRRRNLDRKYPSHRHNRSGLAETSLLPGRKECQRTTRSERWHGPLRTPSRQAPRGLEKAVAWLEARTTRKGSSTAYGRMVGR